MSDTNQYHVTVKQGHWSQCLVYICVRIVSLQSYYCCWYYSCCYCCCTFSANAAANVASATTSATVVVGAAIAAAVAAFSFKEMRCVSAMTTCSTKQFCYHYQTSRTGFHTHASISSITFPILERYAHLGKISWHARNFSLRTTHPQIFAIISSFVYF